MADYTINIDFGALGSTLTRWIEPIVERTAFGLLAADAAPTTVLRLPTFFSVNVPQARKRDFSVVATDFRTWVLASGLRDAIEGVHALLEETNLVCAMVFHTQQGNFTGDVWHRLIAGRAKAFHKKGLPDKVRFMAKAYGFKISEDPVAEILTLNAARNCLAHRAGIVGAEHDCNDPAGLRVCWRKVEIFVRGSAGERVIEEGGAVVAAGEEVCMRTGKEAKLYAPGERVVFTAAEFSQLCHTLITFGQQVARELEEYAKNRGLLVRTPPAVELNPPEGELRLTT